MAANDVYHVCFCGRKGKDVQAWVVQVEDAMYEVGVVDDEEMANFTCQCLQEDAWQFYIKLPKHVQCSWRLMKHALLKHYGCSMLPAGKHVYFCGTDNECIKSWIMRVEDEMLQLAIVDDEEKAMFASQGLSYDAFIFLHMLPKDWRYSWSTLKASLLMCYWKLPETQDPLGRTIVNTFESLQNEFWVMLQILFEYDVWDWSSCGLHDKETSVVDVVEDLSVTKAMRVIDEVSGDGYCSDFESETCSASMLSEDELCDGTSLDDASVDEESPYDDSVVFDLAPFMTNISSLKQKLMAKTHNVDRRKQVMESSDGNGEVYMGEDAKGDASILTGDANRFPVTLPLVEIRDCMPSVDGPDAYVEVDKIESLDEQFLTYDQKFLEPRSQEESICLDSQDNMSFNDDEMMIISPNVCLKGEDVLDDLDGLLDREGGDSFDESVKEGSTATDRPGVPCECVQVAMPLEMDSQMLVSEESFEVASHGSSETEEGDVGCVHLDVTVGCDQYEELQDDNGCEKIDPELDAILDDVLDDFMVMYPSADGSSMINIGQMLDAAEDVHILCNPNDCDVMDLELEAILDDAFVDFTGVNTKEVGILNAIVLDNEQECKGPICESPEQVMIGHMDFMLQPWCTHALMNMIFKVAFKQVMYVKRVLIEAFLCQYLVRDAGTFDAHIDEPWIESPCGSSHANEQEQLGMWHECPKTLVFDPGGMEWFLCMAEWGMVHWPFDPGGF